MALGTPTYGTPAGRGNNGTFTLNSAASGATSDVVLAIIAQKPATANGGTMTPPAGWTLIASKLAAGGYGGTTGAGVGNVNLFIYRQDIPTTGGDNATFTAGDNSAALGMQVRLPAGGGQISIASTTGEDSSGGTSYSFAGAADPGTIAGDVILAGTAGADYLFTLYSHTFSQAGGTFGTLTTGGAGTSTVNDVAVWGWSAPVTAGPGTAPPTASATAVGTTTNARGGAVILRIRETISAAFAKTLGGITSSAAGSAATSGTVGTTLDPLTSTSAAAIPALGESAIMLDGVFGEGQAQALIASALAQNVGPVTAEGAGSSIIAGSSTGSVGPVSLTATATSWVRAPLDRRGVVIDAIRTVSPAAGSRSAIAIGGNRIAFGV